jgi:hypothetical protein
VNTYRLGVNASNATRELATIRLASTAAPEAATFGIASHGAMQMLIVWDKRSGGVSLASDERLTAAGVPYTGDADTDEILDLFPDVLERVRRLRSGEEETFSIEEIAAEFGINL